MTIAIYLTVLTAAGLMGKLILAQQERATQVALQPIPIRSNS